MIRLALCGATRLLCGCHARWNEPLEDARPRIFYANHTSHLDPILVWSMLPREVRARCRTVAAADYWGKDPVRRWLATRVFRAVLINRTEITRENNPLTRMQACLENKESLILFPEGTRGKGEELRAFRSGLWHLAKHCPEVELVPIWIENLNRVLPKGEILPVPLLAAATVGSHLMFEPDESKKAFLTRTRDALLELRPSV